MLNENLKALAAKLEVLNEQFAKQSEKKRRIWRAVFVIIGIFAMVGLVREILLLAQLSQFDHMLESSAAVIGGADEATSIFVSNISFQGFSVIMTVIAGIVAAVGIHHTRRK